MNPQPQVIQVQESPKTVSVDFEALMNNENSIDCLIVLNWNEPVLLHKLVNSAKVVVLADGGANCLFQSQIRDSPKLKAIIGDFDSIRPQVREYYAQKGVEILHDEDQNTTDFQKAFTYAQKEGHCNIAFLGALGGRMDHTLGSMHTSCRICRSHPQMQIILVGTNNLMMPLKPQTYYKLSISKNMQRKTGNGMITFQKTEGIETSGFKWNLGEKYGFTQLQWGVFISTCNQIVEDLVQIYSKGELFFVCQIKEASHL